MRFYIGTKTQYQLQKDVFIILQTYKWVLPWTIIHDTANSKTQEIRTLHIIVCLEVCNGYCYEVVIYT